MPARQLLPDDLEQTPPGPALAAALSKHEGGRPYKDHRRI